MHFAATFSAPAEIRPAESIGMQHIHDMFCWAVLHVEFLIGIYYQQVRPKCWVDLGFWNVCAAYKGRYLHYFDSEREMVVSKGADSINQ